MTANQPVAPRQILEARAVHRLLGQGEQLTHILKGVSLQIPERQYVSIVGASGSGKSTLLYLLGGLDRPSRPPATTAADASLVLIDGRDTSSLSDTELAALRNEKCGFVFQFHYLLKDFTAQENVALPILKRGLLSRSDAYDRAAALLTRLGLADKVKRRTAKLSGGEQQRVAIARAMANKPAVILADEPTGNLDKANGEVVAAIFDELATTGPDDERQSIVMATHDPVLAQRAQRLITMEDGLILRDERLR